MIGPDETALILVGVSFAALLARTASGKLQKQPVRSSLGSLPAP